LGACTVTTTPSGPAGDAGLVPEASTGDAGDLGDCVDYVPASLSGTKTGAFTAKDDVIKIELPQTDIGGGLLEVTLTAQTQSVAAEVWLLSGEKRNEARTNAVVLDGQTGATTVRLHGKTTYELRVLANNYEDGRSNGYTVAYTYTPLVDCYEGNDTRSAAKRVPVNVPIRAYLHPGIGPDDGTLVGPTAADHYTFELDEPKKVTLRGALPAGGTTAYFAVKDASAADVPCDDPQERMGTDPTATTRDVATCTAQLPAGKYWVEVAYANSGPAATGVGSPVPAEWKAPYTMTIEAK